MYHVARKICNQETDESTPSVTSNLSSIYTEKPTAYLSLPNSAIRN